MDPGKLENLFDLISGLEETPDMLRVLGQIRKAISPLHQTPAELRQVAIPRLRELTQRVPNQVLGVACMLLTELKAREAIPDFLEMLEPDAEQKRKIEFWVDPFGPYEESVQELGCSALRRLKVHEAIPAIEKLLSSDQKYIRECAEATLRALKT